MWSMTVDAPDERSAVAAETALSPFSTAISRMATANGWRVQGLTPQPPERADVVIALAVAAAAAGTTVPSATIEPVPAADWVAQAQASLPAVRIGRFCVYGSHLDPGVARGRIGLRIDAGVAFGTGHHASTAGCLKVLSRPGPARRVLDLGCGSGVLAIAAAKRWRVPVTAVDIDPLAVAETKANARRNAVAPLIRAHVGDGVDARVRRSGPFDLILANILARPLKRLAGAVVGCLARPGTLVLAGFTDDGAAAVAAVYAAHGLSLRRRECDSGWTTLVLGYG